MKQLHIYFAALMFLTRLPIPKWVKHDEKYMQQSTTYFPLVGILVGVLLAVSFWCFEKILPTNIAVLLTMALSLLTTGAFHEDGFADMCDAFGGGYTVEKKLEIMKDSRLGTYGVSGLFFILILKYALWQQLAELVFSGNWQLIVLPYYLQFPVIIIIGQSISRLMPLYIIQNYNYVYQTDVSKSKPLASAKLKFGAIFFAIITSTFLFILLPFLLTLTIIPVVLVTLFMGRFIHKHLQGYTGDCLGATQQVAEIMFYLAVIVVTKFIL